MMLRWFSWLCLAQLAVSELHAGLQDRTDLDTNDDEVVPVDDAAVELDLSLVPDG